MKTAAKIRKATPDDLDAIVAVENACFTNEQFSRRQLSYLLSKAKGILYVAQTESGVVGYLSLLQRVDSDNLRIYSIAVHPDARGQQIGQLFIEKSKEYARSAGLQGISLEVRTNNAAAICLYRKYGFIEKEVLLNYYGEGENGFQMYLQDLS